MIIIPPFFFLPGVEVSWFRGTFGVIRVSVGVWIVGSVGARLVIVSSNSACFMIRFGLGTVCCFCGGAACFFGGKLLVIFTPPLIVAAGFGLYSLAGGLVAGMPVGSGGAKYSSMSVCSFAAANAAASCSSEYKGRGLNV